MKSPILHTLFLGICLPFVILCGGCAGPSSDDVVRARRTVDDFMRARMQRNAELARGYVNEYARAQYARDSFMLLGTSNPYFARYEIIDAEELDADRVRVDVQIFEQYSDADEYSGSFVEKLMLVRRSDGRYMVDSVEKTRAVD